MGLRARLEKLERKAPPAFPTSDSIPSEVADYLAVLEGEEVEERRDPELEAYFEELERYEEERKRRRESGSL